MSPTALACLAVIAGYLIGSIPFAYVVVRAAKGIDIRTFGSGNVGATNAGRVLGPRGFLLVFGLDMLKGLIPTLAFSPLVRWRTGVHFEALSVLVALATILGHNFPIYLQFRGGKGVSTSLGATLGLDWIAGTAAAIVFGVALRATKYVSLASLIGASAFVAVHFAVVTMIAKQSPWDREHIFLSVLTLGLFAMLIVRHRKNWGRILDGTEPKIGRRREPPSGRASVWLLAIVAVIGLGLFAFARTRGPASLDCGAFTLVDLGHVATGHQRAIRPTFGDGGKALAVLCPRYDRMMIYRLDDAGSIRLTKDVALDGQPMSVAATRGGWLCLERPSGDDRHIRPGFLQVYTLDGTKSGPPIAVGFYPRDLALFDDGRTALVLTAGRSEGSDGMAAPALEIVELTGKHPNSHVSFNKPGDLPNRICVSPTSPNVAVSLSGTDEVAAIDLTDRANPRLIGRSSLAKDELPYLSRSGEDAILMPVRSDREFAVIPDSKPRTPLSGHMASVHVDASELDIRPLGSSRSLGRFPLRDSANLASIRPTGVAVSPDRSRIAVTSRSGGVHLIAIKPPIEAASDPTVAGDSLASRSSRR